MTLSSSFNLTDEAASTTVVLVEQTPNMVILGTLIALIIFLSLLFLYLVIPPIYLYIKSRIPVSPKRLEARYATIEGWIISKRVRECAGSGGCPCEEEEQQQQKGGGALLKQASSYDTAETCNDSSCTPYECPICMSDFKVDEIVSWSPNPACKHVFHHECIKEWLVRHACCPFCRTTYLPVDEAHHDDSATASATTKKLTQQRHKQLAHERRLRSMQTMFCVKSGLVEIDSSSKKKMAGPNVKVAELQVLRGSRTETTNGSFVMDEDDDQEVPTEETTATTTLQLGGDAPPSGGDNSSGLVVLFGADVDDDNDEEDEDESSSSDEA